MAVIAATVLLEKTWSHGRAVSKMVGVALIVFSFFVPENPALLPGLHASSHMQVSAFILMGYPVAGPQSLAGTETAR